MLRLQSLCARSSVRIAVSEIGSVSRLLPSLSSPLSRGLSSSSSSSSRQRGHELPHGPTLPAQSAPALELKRRLAAEMAQNVARQQLSSAESDNTANDSAEKHDRDRSTNAPLSNPSHAAAVVDPPSPDPSAALAIGPVPDSSAQAKQDAAAETEREAALQPTFGCLIPLGQWSSWGQPADRGHTYFGPIGSHWGLAFGPCPRGPLPLEYVRWTHAQEMQRREQAEAERQERVDERRLAAQLSRHTNDRRNTYFGTKPYHWSSLISLESQRRVIKRREDHTLTSKTAAAKKQAEEEEKQAVEQRLQQHLRQTPPASVQAFDSGADQRRLREFQSDEQVTAIALLPSELEAADGPRFSPWKQVRFYARDVGGTAHTRPTSGPEVIGKPGLYELAVKTLDGRLLPVYLGSTRVGIRQRLKQPLFMLIKRWIRVQTDFEQMLYVRELRIARPAGYSRESFTALLQQRRDRLLKQLDYFGHPLGQHKKLHDMLTVNTLRGMHAALMERAASVEDRSTSKGRATLLGESGEPEPVDLPNDAETKQ